MGLPASSHPVSLGHHLWLATGQQGPEGLSLKLQSAHSQQTVLLTRPILERKEEAA